MNTTNLFLFPTLVSVTNNFLNEEEVKTVLRECENIDVVEHDSLVNGYSSFSTNSNFIDLFPDIKQRIFLKFNQYCSELNLKNVEITNSWFNVQRANSYLKNHAHPSSTLSAALYINVGDQSSPLVFLNPNYFMAYLLSSQVNNDYHKTTATKEFFPYYPNNGDLIIFPSWLTHGSNGVVNNYESRTVVSINCTFSKFENINAVFNKS